MILADAITVLSISISVLAGLLSALLTSLTSLYLRRSVRPRITVKLKDGSMKIVVSTQDAEDVIRVVLSLRLPYPKGGDDSLSSLEPADREFLPAFRSRVESGR
jgi:hypothetical protein